MATREDIKNVIFYMKASFPNYHPELEGEVNTVDVLLDQLGDMDANTLQMAVRAACMPGTGRQFAPSSDEIRTAIANLHAQATGLPSAGEAWGAVIGSFERMPGGNMAGGGHGPILDHPIMQEVIRQIGGYSAIDYEDQMADRAHFLKLYSELRERSVREMAELPAITAYVNSKRLGDSGQTALLEMENAS